MLPKFIYENCGKIFSAYYQTGHKARVYCNKECHHINIKNFQEVK